MKRNRGTKSKPALSPAKASSSPAKASSSPAKASSSPEKSSVSPARPLSSQAKALSSPARSVSSPTVATKLRKRPVRKSPAEEQQSNNTTDATTVADKLQDNATESTSATGVVPPPQDDSRASSPDPNCSICLCKMEDKSFTHSCFHMFCFTCLLEWSKIKAECPLCKQSFTSIIHNIRSESDYDVYYLRDAVAPSPPAVSPDDDVQLFPFLFGRNPLRSWTPILSPLDLQLIAEFRGSTHGMTQGFYGADEAFHIFQHMEGRNQIYRDERWAREINLPPGLNYRTVSPEYFATSVGSEYWQLIATWLDRELATLLRHNVGMRTHVRDCILHLLQRYDVRSVNFHAEVEPFFGSQTRLFVNQLYNFVRSPLTIRETDRQTVYSDRPPTPPESEVITLDRDDSDIEIVSPSGVAMARRRRHHHNEHWPHSILDPFISLPPPPPRSLQIVGAGNALRLDSPIPGPSGLLPRPNLPDHHHDFPFDDNNVTDLHEVSDSEESSTSHGDNEIVVVGFDKPWRARSPISLSSDGSDVEVDEGSADTNPSSSNKSPESSEVRLQSISHINGLEVVVPKAPDDAEGDVSSRPWSEFSPGALSEISNGGSFDKALEHFLQSTAAGNPFVGFERRFAPEKGLEVLEKGVDCSRSERRRSISEEVVVNAVESQALADDSILPKRQTHRKPQKRNRDDCGDSGVVVDVEQFGDTAEEEEPPAKKAVYKKHFRGHKRSSTSRPEGGSLESDGAHWEESAIDGPGEVSTNGGGSSSTRESESSSSSTNGSRSGVSSTFHPESSEESLHGKCMCDGADKERPPSACCSAPVGRNNGASSFTSTCDNNNSTEEDPNAKSSVDSSQRSVESTENHLASDDSTAGSTTLTDSSDSSGLCDDDVHSVESIDSDDSVQWLDSERPAMAMSIQQRKRHISIGSNDESSVYSSSVSSIVLQLSDEDEEEEEDDCRRAEEMLLLPDVVGDTLRPSPLGSYLVEFEARQSSLGGATSRQSPQGLTGHSSLGEASSRHSPQGSNLVGFEARHSSLGGTNSRHSPQTLGFEAGHNSLGGGTSRHSPNGFNLVGFEATHSSLGGGTSRHTPQSLNLVGFEAGLNSLGGATSRHSSQGLNLVGFEPVNNSLGGTTSRHSPQSFAHSEDDKTKTNDVRHLSEFLEDISNDLDSTINDDSVARLSQNSSESESLAPTELVNCVECFPVSSRNIIECNSVDNDISKSENVSNEALCNEKTVNGVECLLESSGNARELDDNGISDVVPCNETLVNGVVGLADEVNHSVVQPVILGADDGVSELLVRTSDSCPVEEALERAINELPLFDDGSKKLQSNGSPPVDENCCGNA